MQSIMRASRFRSLYELHGSLYKPVQLRSFWRASWGSGLRCVQASTGMYRLRDSQCNPRCFLQDFAACTSSMAACTSLYSFAVFGEHPGAQACAAYRLVQACTGSEIHNAIHDAFFKISQPVRAPWQPVQACTASQFLESI